MSAHFIEITLSPTPARGSWPVSALGWLDAGERARCAEFRREPDRRRFIASRIRLRESLAGITATRPADWRFRREATGQWKIAPEAGLPPFHISTAHAGDAVAVAVSDTCPVGIDIERLGPDGLPIDGALGTLEREWLTGIPSQVRDQETLSIWTAKEAYAKLRGLGVGVDFSAFDVAIYPLRLLRTEDGVIEPEDVHLVSRSWKVLRDTYRMTLAFRSHHPEAPAITIFERKEHGAVSKH